METKGIDEMEVPSGTISNGPTDKDSDVKETAVPKYKATFKVWCAIAACLICYVVSLYGMLAISTQYFSKRIARDDYDFDFTDKTENECDNSTSDEESRVDKVQRDVAALQLKFTLTTGIPALVTCLLVGSYSDFIGRKPLLLISTVGGFLKLLTLCLVIGFETDLRYFYIGALLDGLVGSFFTTVTAVTAIIADITLPAERAIKFAVIEGILLSSVAVSQVAIGLSIKGIGYLSPSIFLASLFLIVMALIIFFCPETSGANPNATINPMAHLRRVFGFYFVNDSSNKQPLYLLGLLIFFLGTSTNAGRGNVEVLFETSFPMCWNSVEVGVFAAVRLLAMAAAAVAFLKLTEKRLPLEMSGFICAMSATAGFVIESLAEATGFMILSTVAGVLYLAIVPIPRALLSQLASADEQGALFSSLSTVDVIGTMSSQAIYTAIYNSTLDTFKGAVFIAVASLCFINGTLLIIFLYRRRAILSPSQTATIETLNSTDVPVIPKATSSNESSPLLKEK